MIFFVKEDTLGGNLRRGPIRMQQVLRHVFTPLACMSIYEYIYVSEKVYFSCALLTISKKVYRIFCCGNSSYIRFKCADIPSVLNAYTK